MERGELDEPAFCARFEAEAAALGFTVDARAVLGQLTGQIRPELVAVIRACSRATRSRASPTTCRSATARRWRVTPTSPPTSPRSWRCSPTSSSPARSARRKPEPRFYTRACEVVGVAPEHCVFLDDLGINLKPARALGMATIKVGDPAAAIAELEAILAIRCAELGSRDQRRSGTVKAVHEP